MPAIYLFTGPELGEKKTVLDRVLKKTEKNIGSLDIHKLYAIDSSVMDIILLLQGGSLFSDAVVVIVRNAELIKKKEDIALIENWLKTHSNATLILISDENAIEKKLDVLVPKENKQIFWEMFENRKEQWIQNFFTQNGYRIEQSAIKLILELVENNTEQLKIECSRFLICFEKGSTLTRENIENVLFHNREENVFTLFDIMTKKNTLQQRIESSLSILQKLNLSKSHSAIQILAGLVFCFRRLQQWHILHQAGYPSDFDLKIKGFAGKKIQDQYRCAQAIWNISQVNAIIALLIKTDFEIRSMGTTFENTYLQYAIYKIIVTS
ncbi:MAG: DNA polymerase III subunit delta [Treponemataceae bacterium]